jgi:hypothetical protein
VFYCKNIVVNRFPSVPLFGTQSVQCIQFAHVVDQYIVANEDVISFGVCHREEAADVRHQVKEVLVVLRG